MVIPLVVAPEAFVRPIFLASALCLLCVCSVSAQDNIAALAAICDQAAASPLDQTRPAGIPGVEIDKVDPKIAVPACEAAAKAAPNDPRIAYQLGRAYFAAKTYESARAQYVKADQAGHGLASNNLAVLYAEGQGVAQDQEKARELLEKAAFAGVALAMNTLGTRYYEGKLVPQDYKEAFYWFEKGAAAGMSLSMGNIALLYEKGQGTRQDYVQARYWFEKAAAKGHVVAMAKLGFYYTNGFGGPKDYGEARRWYEKAIAAGNTDPIVRSNLQALVQRASRPRDYVRRAVPSVARSSDPIRCYGGRMVACPGGACWQPSC